MTDRTSKDLEVAIIGAGPSGIQAAKAILEAFPKWREEAAIAVFEESGDVGGIWNRDGRNQRGNYTPDLHIADAASKQAPPFTLPVASSTQPIYEDLSANVPRDLLNFQDMPFPRDVPMFPKPHQLGTYFREYAKRFELSPFIQFHTTVVECTKQQQDDGDSQREGASGGAWTIMVTPSRNTQLEHENDTMDTENAKETSQTRFYTSKRVLVCTGHHRKAFVPSTIAGIRHFRGIALHSSAFQSPEACIASIGSQRRNSPPALKLLIVGGSISGADIAKTCAKTMDVAVSVRRWRTIPHKLLLSSFRKQGKIRTGISHIDEDGVVHFNNGDDDSDMMQHPFRPDIILFATGYRYAYPFLSTRHHDAVCEADGFKMKDLYLRMLHRDDPSLGFIGIPTQVMSPMMMIETQMHWYVRQGSCDLSKETMQKEIDARKDDATQDSMQLIPGFIVYFNQMARLTGTQGFWRSFYKHRLFPLLSSIWTLCIWPQGDGASMKNDISDARK
eukprot:CAMPEP_0198132646 /NCGR_PEP_ID=MMETSP1442-20131203/58751_1 /TAXON_ID= /ORGANISM="Craspedostauros australis, Strain CCMP3328" /LENGTH=502 /DNA_ID=CAMNT_0043793697 /DNA_START=52 /DNA_END=1557 /DNA_ORIENTATION=+